MNRLIWIVITTFLMVLVVAFPTYALSSTFLPKAQTYYNNQCLKNKISNEVSMLCYLFDRVAELDADNSSQDTTITQLQNTIASQSAKISALEERIESLEDLHPEPTTINFATNKPQPFDSEWINVEGYNTMKINLSITGFITDYAIHYTNDPNLPEFTLQQGVNCNSSSTCPEATISILGKYYRISTGTASGNVTSSAQLE